MNSSPPESQANVIFDMDSTVIKSESLEKALELILLKQDFDEEKIQEIMAEIKEATNAGMAKGMPLSETIPLRLGVLNRHGIQITQERLERMNLECQNDILEGVQEMLNSLKTEFGHQLRLIMISGGDQRWVAAVCKRLGIEEYAGNTINVADGKFDSQTSKIENSKIPATWQILGDNLDPDKTIINGDGGTDKQLWDEGLAKFFIGNLIVAKEEDRPNITELERACDCDNYSIIRTVEEWKQKLLEYINTILIENVPDSQEVVLEEFA